MSWSYVGQETLFGPGKVYFQELMLPGTWVQIFIPLVPDQYAQQWGVAFGWTDSTQIPSAGLTILTPSRILYNKRTLFRLPETPQGQVRVGVYRTVGATIAVQDVIVFRWNS